MSDGQFSRAHAKEYGPVGAVLLYYLVTKQKHQPECIVSMDELHGEIPWATRKTISRALKTLEAAGAITKQRVPNKRTLAITIGNLEASR